MHPSNNPLRRARITRGLSVSQIAARTLLSPRIVDLLDEGRFADLPGGVYARSHVRAYAAVVDLDPEETLAELEPLLPAAADPLPTLLTLARVGDPPWVVALEDAMTRAKECVTGDGLATRLAPLVVGIQRPAVDGLALLLLLGGLLQVSALATSSDVAGVIRDAGLPVAAMWGMLVLIYAAATRLQGGARGIIIRAPRDYASAALRACSELAWSPSRAWERMQGSEHA